MQSPWRNSLLIITNIQCDDQLKAWKVRSSRRLRFGRRSRRHPHPALGLEADPPPGRAQIVEDHVGGVAAGIAFYGLIAVFPAIAALVAISGLVLDPADLGSTMERIFTMLPPDAAGIIRDQLLKVTDSGTGTGLVAASGLAIALYGAIRGMTKPSAIPRSVHRFWG